MKVGSGDGNKEQRSNLGKSEGASEPLEWRTKAEFNLNLSWPSLGVIFCSRQMAPDSPWVYVFMGIGVTPLQSKSFPAINIPKFWSQGTAWSFPFLPSLPSIRGSILITLNVSRQVRNLF